ncbi:MAG: methyl-accepting chemotaxis protein, partial [Campylobacterales bacterium]|nr:methyl-accepting chemotaxis protein [Campylobacterales bacterium]
SSKEQQSAIIQINDAVVNLDRATQNNASVADQISKMSVSIEQMSSNLVNAASKASFLQETRKQVCDVDLIYEIANLKVDLFNYKDDVYARLADFNNNSVKQFSKLDVWLNEFKQKNSNIDSTLIKQLQEMNENLYNYLTELMNSSTSGVDNDTLNNIAKKVEIESMRIFGTLNKIKEAKCSNER